MQPQSNMPPCPNGFQQQSEGMTSPYQVQGDYTTIILTDRYGDHPSKMYVDTADLPAILALPHPIHPSVERSKFSTVIYARHRVGGANYRFHRWLLGAGPSDEIDHINHNGLDNRRQNLRIATRSENTSNRRMGEFRARRLVLQRKDNPDVYGAWVFLGEFGSEQDANAVYSDANGILTQSGFWESYHYRYQADEESA